MDDVKVMALGSVTIMVVAVVAGIVVSPESASSLLSLVVPIIPTILSIFILNRVSLLETNMNSKMDEALKVQRAAGKAEGILQEKEKEGA